MAEVRTVALQGGPLDGVDKHLHPRMHTEFPVVCPWSDDPERPATVTSEDGSVVWERGPDEPAPFHLAFARYRPDGTWVETRCTAVLEGDEPLVERPD